MHSKYTVDSKLTAALKNELRATSDGAFHCELQGFRNLVAETVNVIIASQKKTRWMFLSGQQMKDKIVIHKYRKTTNKNF